MGVRSCFDVVAVLSVAVTASLSKASDDRRSVRHQNRFWFSATRYRGWQRLAEWAVTDFECHSQAVPRRALISTSDMGSTASLSSFLGYPSGGARKGGSWLRKVGSSSHGPSTDGRRRWGNCIGG